MIGDWWMGLGGAAYEGWMGQQHGHQQFNPNLNALASSQYNQYNSQCSGLYQQQFQPVAPAVTERKADCEGCGAPLKAYIHHCEYCRRAAC